MHLPHVWFFDYFWLFCGTWCGIGGALLLRFRLRASIAAGGFTSEEATWLAIQLALWILLPSAAFWALQMSVGADASPFFFTWPEPQLKVALGLQVCLWVALLYWVFIRGGAITASKVLWAVSRRPSFMHTPSAVKAQAVALVLAGVAAFVFAPRA